MIGIFKQKNPAIIFMLLLFGVFIKLPMFLYPHAVAAHPEEGVLFKAILKFLEPAAKSFPSVYAIMAFFLLLLQAIMLTGFINSQRMMNKATYFPGMSYLLITSLFPEWNYFSAPLLVNTILLFVLSQLFVIYNQQNVKGTIYNIGLALGIASFLFFPSLTFIIWILLALAVMRPFRLNEWVLCLFGVTTPFYFYGIYLIVTEQWSWGRLWPYVSIRLPYVQQSLWMAGGVFLLTIPFLLGGYYVQENLRRMLIQVRKGWSLLLLYLLGAIFVTFVNNTNTLENWVMVAIPFAAFHACTYLYTTIKILPVLLFWMTVAFILGYQYMGPGW